MTTRHSPALLQAAQHRSAVLLERCRHDLPPATTVQARWHARQQAAFLAWLDAGGFAQHDAAIENSGVAPLLSVPQGDLNEESKFSLLRIDDAVE